MLKVIGWYHLFQASLLFLTMLFYGYTYRIDAYGPYESYSPILWNALLGVCVVLWSRYSRESAFVKSTLNISFLIIIWSFSSILKMLSFNFFIVDAFFNYLMPVLLFADQSNHTTRRITYIVVLSGFIFFSTLGARGYALLPLLLFTGPKLILFSQRSSRIKLFMVSVIFVSGLGFYMNIIEVYRVVYGRDTVDLNGIIYSVMNSSEHKDDLINYVGMFRAPWDRALNHPMASMVDFVGNIRGMDFIIDDLLLTLDRTNSNYTNSDYGHWVSAKYGFNATRTSSVEWSILSDFSSRFGPAFGTLVTFLSYLFLTGLVKVLSFKNNLIRNVLSVHVCLNFFVFNLFEISHMIIKASMLLVGLLILSRNEVYRNWHVWKR